MENYQLKGVAQVLHTKWKSFFDSMSAKDYKLTKWSKYALSLVFNTRAFMNKFTSGVFDLVKMECKAMILIKQMYISRLMTYAKQVESEKLQKMTMKESKRAHFNGAFTHAKSDGSCRNPSLGPRSNMANENPRVTQNSLIASIHT